MRISVLSKRAHSQKKDHYQFWSSQNQITLFCRAFGVQNLFCRAFGVQNLFILRRPD